MPEPTPKSKKRQWLKFLRLVPLVLLAWVVWKMRPWDVDFGSIRAWPIAVGIAINLFVFMPIKAIRWSIALDHPPRFFTVFVAMMEGQLANMTIGMGSGELVRSARLRPGAGAFASDLGSTLAERATEYLALAIMVVATWLLGVAGWIVAVVAGAFIVGYLSVLAYGNRIVPLLRRWPRVQQGLNAALMALTPGRALLMTLLSLAGWGSEMVFLMLTLWSFGLVHDPGTAAMVIVGINAAIAIPVSPANVGTFEAGVLAALALRGIDATTALGFAVAYHLFSAVPVAVFAAILSYGRRDLAKNES